MSIPVHVCLSFGLLVFLSVCLSVCLSFCLSVCLSVCLYFFLSVCMSVCPSVSISLCPYACPFSNHLRYVLAELLFNIFSIFLGSPDFFPYFFSEDCVDRTSPYKCIFLQTLHMCSSPGLQTFMINECPKTCDFCGKNSISKHLSI